VDHGPPDPKTHRGLVLRAGCATPTLYCSCGATEARAVLSLLDPPYKRTASHKQAGPSSFTRVGTLNLTKILQGTHPPPQKTQY
jgi:hypothetical protein